MARLRDVPFAQVGEVIGGARAGQRARHACVRVAVVLEPDAPRELAGALHAALMPETAAGLVHVAAIRPDAPVRVNPDADAAIVVLARPGGPGAGVARAFRDAGVPCAIVVETSVEAPEGTGLEGVALVAAASSEVLLDKLATWLADACEADIALAANFPFVRRAVATHCVRTRSAQNAAVGLLPFGSGADLPVMAANQALMALDVASAYGAEASLARLAEMAWVAGGALASRSLARALCGALPGLGLLIKAGVAYGGTAALGAALVARFELADALSRRA